MFRRSRRVLAALASALLPAAPLAAQSSLAEQVNAAIDRGVAWMKSRQAKDGTFPCDHWCPVGSTALATYALLKSGVSARDPAIQKAIAFLRYQPFEHTYAVSVEIAALDALGLGTPDDKALVTTLHEGAKWLEERQRDDGLWAYPDKLVDLSNTQYAVLGLWIAERHGFKAKRETWGKLLKEVTRRQNEDGGFGYREGDISTGSMTTAGIAMLLLALERVEGDSRYGSAREKGRAALERAWKWLENHFTVDGNPRGDRTVVPTVQLYYLFGLERVGAIASRKTIGDHDWYAEGARRLVRIQRPEGNWNDGDATSFALLFLRRATFTGMQRSKDGDPDTTRAGSGATADEFGDARRPLPKVPFLKRWLVCGPIPDPQHELLEASWSGEAKLEAKRGSSYRERVWQESRELDDFTGFGERDEPGEKVLWHAFTWLHASEDSEAVLWFGANDGARVFLDGKPILARHVHEEARRDRVSAPVKLAKGAHRLLVKVENDNGKSGFYLRFARADGTAVTSIKPSLDKSDPDLAATALAMPGLFTLAELRANLPPLARVAIDFDKEADLRLLAFDDVSEFEDRYPRWLEASGTGPGNPHPGARGILNVHPLREAIPARIYLRTTVPKAPAKLVVRASEEPYAQLGRGDFISPRGRGDSISPGGRGDFILRLGVFADELHWSSETAIGPSDASSPEGWRTIEASLDAWQGQDVLLILECAAGGLEPFTCEHAYIDEIAIR